MRYFKQGNWCGTTWTTTWGKKTEMLNGVKYCQRPIFNSCIFFKKEHSIFRNSFNLLELDAHMIRVLYRMALAIPELSPGLKVFSKNRKCNPSRLMNGTQNESGKRFMFSGVGPDEMQITDGLRAPPPWTMWNLVKSCIIPQGGSCSLLLLLLWLDNDQVWSSDGTCPTCWCHRSERHPAWPLNWTLALI